MGGWGNLADVRVNTYVVSGLKPMYLYLYVYLRYQGMYNYLLPCATQLRKVQVYFYGNGTTHLLNQLQSEESI